MSEEKPPFMKAIVWCAIIIGLIIVAMINHLLLWKTAEEMYLGWDTDIFISETAMLVGWGIVVPSIFIALSIIGLKIYEQTEIITLIFGIGIAAIGTITAIISGVQIATNTGFAIERWSIGLGGFYILSIIIAACGVVFTLLLAFTGKNIINYYYTKQA